MGKIEVMVNMNANDLPPSIRYADWTVEELDASIAEEEKNPPKSWAEAAQAASLWVAPKYRDKN